MNQLDYAIAQLRHAYALMVNGHVHASQGGITTLAEGLIAPQIKRLEDYQRDVAAPPASSRPPERD